MSEAQRLMAEVMRVHRFTSRRINNPNRPGFLLNVEACKGCDWHGIERNNPDHDGHVAAEIDKALGGLTREYCARHHSGGGALGFTTESDASRHIADNPPVPGGVERPPDPGYSGAAAGYLVGQR